MNSATASEPRHDGDMAVVRHHSKLTDMGLLIMTQPDVAAEKLNALLDDDGGNLQTVAPKLGVNYRTLKRWAARLEEAGFLLRRLGRGGHEKKPPPITRRRTRLKKA